MTDAPTDDLDPLASTAVEALGHETRARILHYLRVHGSSTRGTLAESLDVNVKTMQFHLSLLRRAGVVHARAKVVSAEDWHRHVYERDAGRVDELLRALETAV